MKGNELRQAYLQFFESKGHLKLDSFSLIPENDPSLLLIGAGMAPLKPFFTGKLVPPCRRITTCQKSMRTGDLENVGRTARHHTFFEMLGNFSFGDYFKKEAIHWAWEFLTEVIKLDKNRLYVTVYPDDQEAYDTWHNDCGVEESHITRLEDNFWEIGEGPCGPDSEIFFDQGPEHGCDDPNCAPGCDCDRYLEIWNLVFTQFNKMPDGSYEPLQHKNIDTGAGLDRAVTALISDGVLPSNEGRGYVLRRILRRAVRHGRLLGIEGIFLTPLIDVVVDILGPGITSIAEKQDFVKRVVQNEEERFNQTLEQGLELLNSLIDTLAAEKATVVPGSEVFKLYDTYGFPWELTEEIASERGFTIDHEGFEAAMKEQRERAREARVKEDAKVATPDITFLKDEELLEDEAVEASSVLMIGKGAERLQTAADGDEITIIVRTTPFHAEGGGQLGDTGFIVGPMGKVEVHNTKRLPEGTVYHIGTVIEGSISEGDDVTLEVDTNRRAAMARNHTATHLLHAALKQILGEHVNQAGSLVTPDYLRFDFTHFSPVTQEELDQIEALVNEEILKATDLAIAEMSMDEAKAKGAMALFGDKYGDVVRVVEVPGFSVELCGGSHVGNTAFIGSFHLTSEAGIGSGVRRIEAITGRAALDAAKQDRLTIERMASELKTKAPQIEERLHQVLAEAKETAKELEQIRKEVSAAGAADIIAGKVMIGDVEFVGAAVKASSIDELRDLADMGLDKLNGSGVVLVGAAMGDDKVNFVCKVSKDVVAKGAKAG
ncbi:MAG: alanine--tRNA ligase, partial [Veillonella sp.]|nr:alanine--tRNA ligase [Veillonella sp.]